VEAVADSRKPCSEKVKWNPYRNRPLPTLSYCVVNTNGREFLLACLAAIERTHPAGVEREILVLDNASTTAPPPRCGRLATTSA